MAYYREKAIRAGPASAASRRNAASDCSEAQDDGRRTCARLRGTALGVGSVPAGRRSLSGSRRQGGINPNRGSTGCAHGWRYAMPLDTAVSRVRACARVARARLRAYRGAKNAEAAPVLVDAGCGMLGQHRRRRRRTSRASAQATRDGP